ncbi:MAG: DUF4178 domain-containing protein [Alphaproteobacteria bacterium]
MTEQKHIPGSVKAFNCPQCGGAIAIRAVGITTTAACASCGSIIDVTNPELRIIQAANNKTQIMLDLPIGSRGSLFGHEWEVIGYMERSNLSYSWSEYLLFNPWQGFRFLVEDSGHWSFVKMLRQDINAASRDTIGFEGATYKLYDSGSAKVTYVLGEFYWRVKVGEEADTRDYIAPPYMLSREESGQDIIWSLGVYVNPQIVRDAFQVTENWPAPEGIAPNQPCLAKKHMASLWCIAGAFSVLLLFWALAAHGKQEVLIDTQIQATAAQRETPVVTDEFTIPDPIGNLKITGSSPVYNDWVEVDSELVNQESQVKDESIQEISYYRGIDTDGTAWAEGSQASQDVLSAVPGGKYRLILTTDAGAFAGALAHQGSASVNYQLRVIRNTDSALNLLLGIVMLLLWPACLLMYASNFEKRRWAESAVTLPHSSLGEH